MDSAAFICLFHELAREDSRYGLAAAKSSSHYAHYDGIEKYLGARGRFFQQALNAHQHLCALEYAGDGARYDYCDRGLPHRYYASAFYYSMKRVFGFEIKSENQLPYYIQRRLILNDDAYDSCRKDAQAHGDPDIYPHE